MEYEKALECLTPDERASLTIVDSYCKGREIPGVSDNQESNFEIIRILNESQMGLPGQVTNSLIRLNEFLRRPE